MEVVERYLLRWYDHIMRMGPPKKMPSYMLPMKVCEKSPIGKPKKRWRDGVRIINAACGNREIQQR